MCNPSQEIHQLNPTRSVVADVMCYTKKLYNMRNIVEDYFEFYETFKEKYSEILKIKNVGILSEFLDNKNNIIEFHKKYVQPNSPKIVMCGINPGRRGAGITGIPFIYTNSLSKILPDISNPKTEKSSKFFFSIIEEFGINGFYRNVHVTNMSWFCLLYTSDAADEEDSVDLGGRRIIKKKK